MGTKTISITDDAYRRLLSLKKDSESFSMIIERITGKIMLDNFFGVLSGEGADRLERLIEDNRNKTRKLHNKRNKKIKEVFK